MADEGARRLLGSSADALTDYEENSVWHPLTFAHGGWSVNPARGVSCHPEGRSEVLALWRSVTSPGLNGSGSACRQLGSS